MSTRGFVIFGKYGTDVVETTACAAVERDVGTIQAGGCWAGDLVYFDQNGPMYLLAV